MKNKNNLQRKDKKKYIKTTLQNSKSLMFSLKNLYYLYQLSEWAASRGIIKNNIRTLMIDNIDPYILLQRCKHSSHTQQTAASLIFFCSQINWISRTSSHLGFHTWHCKSEITKWCQCLKKKKLLPFLKSLHWKKPCNFFACLMFRLCYSVSGCADRSKNILLLLVFAFASNHLSCHVSWMHTNLMFFLKYMQCWTI